MKVLPTILLVLITHLCIGQNPNDCEGALLVCGNLNIGLEPDGVGFDEFSLPGNTAPSCYSFNNQTIWLKIIIEGSGTLTFDLIPESSIADYDFAIYGPNVTCTTLGAPIRCSSTNPADAGVSANTGLNMTETDVTEGPGPDGNGYLRFIDALAGEDYYILIDRPHGSGGFSIEMTGTAILPDSPTAYPVSNISKCDDDGIQDGFNTFYFDPLIPIIIGSQINVVVTFHESLNDANIGINELTSPYPNTSNPQTIFVRIENTLSGCTDFTDFTIEIDNSIPLNPIEDILICTDDISQSFDLSTLISDVVDDTTGYDFSFYVTQDDADTGTSSIGPIITLSHDLQTIYIRVNDSVAFDCYSTTFFEISLRYLPPIIQPTDFIICDDDFDGFHFFTLIDKSPEILGSLDVDGHTIFYFSTLEDRDLNINWLSATYQNITSPQTIYVSVIENESQCFSYTQFDLIVNPIPDISLPESFIYCLNATEPLTLSVEAGFDFYEWNTGEEGANLNSIEITSPGSYSVTVTNEFNCTTTVSTTVLGSDVATITDIIIVDFNGSENSVTILVEGLGDYEFALNNEFEYQDSNIFIGLPNGLYTVYVRDKNGCGVVLQEIVVLDYPRYLTPNGDGYHDTWRIIGMERFSGSKIYIYDRFGKMIRVIKHNSIGWDGTYKGNPLPSSDYWFRIEIENKPTIRGHFSLIRR